MKKTYLPLMISTLSLTAFVFPAFAEAPQTSKSLIQAQMQQAQHINPTELNQALKSDNNIILLDVRQKSERPIMGSISEEDLHIPRGFIEIKTYSKIHDHDAEIVVFCGKGIRSAFVTNTLKEMGYTDVKNLKGGVKAWKEAGFKTFQPN